MIKYSAQLHIDEDLVLSKEDIKFYKNMYGFTFIEDKVDLTKKVFIILYDIECIRFLLGDNNSIEVFEDGGIHIKLK